MRHFSDNDYDQMELGETRTFKIDKLSKPNCKLEEDEISIQKTEEKKDSYSFSMSLRNARSFIRCFPGEVKNVKVSPKAENCGIGKILMKLCLNEEQIHNVENNDISLALKAMKSYKTFPSIEKMETWIKSSCKKLLFLMITSTPKSKGHLYFNSALETGYTEMFFALDKEFYPEEGGCSVEALQKRYTDDGHITDNDGTPVRVLGDDKIKVFAKNWFFCQPKNPTLKAKCPTEL